MTKEFRDKSRSISRDEVERSGLTQEEGVAKYGFKWVDAMIKTQKPHDSDRHLRNRQRSEKAEGKKRERRLWD